MKISLNIFPRKDNYLIQKMINNKIFPTESNIYEHTHRENKLYIGP